MFFPIWPIGNPKHKVRDKGHGLKLLTVDSGSLHLDMPIIHGLVQHEGSMLKGGTKTIFYQLSR